MSVQGEPPGGEGRGTVRCRPCGKDFAVVGRPDAAMSPANTPMVELLACPHCKTARRTMLPAGVAPPIVRVEALD